MTATNKGAQAVTELTLYDTTPSFTTLESSTLTPKVSVGGADYTAAGNCNTPTPGISAPADEAAGLVSGLICNLSSGASATLEFSVQIDE